MYDMRSWDYKRLKLEFHQKFYPMHLVHRDRNYIYNFGLANEKASLKLGGGLSQCYIHAPIMSSQDKLLFNFLCRLSLNNRSMLDTSCTGSFMMKTIEFK